MHKYIRFFHRSGDLRSPVLRSGSLSSSLREGRPEVATPVAAVVFSWTRRLGALMATLQFLHADEPAPLIPGSYTVLASVTVQRGDHSVTYNRISPPQVLPKASPVTQPAVDDGKAHAAFAIGATVYDHAVTELHWTTPGTGAQHTAYSNIDFTVFTGIADFEWANTVWDASMMIGESSRAEPASDIANLPAITEFPASQSIYFVLADDTFTAADEALFTALDALHSYFDANRAVLVQAHAQRETERLAHEQWLRDHPPLPKDTVIHFWKKPSTAGGAK